MSERWSVRVLLEERVRTRGIRQRNREREPMLLRFALLRALRAMPLDDVMQQTADTIAQWQTIMGEGE